MSVNKYDIFSEVKEDKDSHCRNTLSFKGTLQYALASESDGEIRVNSRLWMGTDFWKIIIFLLPTKILLIST